MYGGNRKPPEAGARRTVAAEIAARATFPENGNTTLTVVVTDATLEPDELRQFGRQVHTSLARAIQPFHTMNDGDVLWAVTTGTHPRVEPTPLGVLASDVAWDAVLSAAR